MTCINNYYTQTWEDTDSVLGENDLSVSTSSMGYLDPIVVAYAFGPKKMKSMGVVMAEASQVPVIHEEEILSDSLSADLESTGPTLATTASASSSLQPLHATISTTTTNTTTTSSLTQAALETLQPKNQTSTILSYGSANNTNLNDIVRYFRSSCSSVASRSETTVSTPTTFQSSNSRKGNPTTECIKRRSPVRISFVPLDPDCPLEEQHGGHFDLILHKLTEDILACSLLEDDPESDSVASFRRVKSLKDYQQQVNPRCCLVDDPYHVQTLMSRSSIAEVLERCLRNVHSTSGIPVKSPKFIVASTDSSASDLANLLQVKQLSVPLIVKPLVAAGTKESHYMAIVLNNSALSKVPPKSIIQEYVNHNATLYKVYVLGEHVYVYSRPSLPNLPPAVTATPPSHEAVEAFGAGRDLVEFDSQRPYPRLQDFGMATTEDATASLSSSTSPSVSSVKVTPDEVRPIVESLKEAFGLDLFGFDILLSEDQTEWLVVDVNYFPSYKEVPNFPSLLAHYLSQRVLEQRRRGDEDQVCCGPTSNTLATTATTATNTTYNRY